MRKNALIAGVIGFILLGATSYAASWNVQAVEDVGYSVSGCSIALDANNRPCISYLDYHKGNLKYASWTGASWDKEIVDTAVNNRIVGEFSSLKIDDNGVAHISYYDASNDDLKYARKNGSTWETKSVDTAGDVGWYTSLALDSNGNPYISYIGMSDKSLRYAHLDGSSWTTEIVSSNDSPCYYTSIAIDNNDNPYIAYEAYYTSLKCNSYQNSIWSTNLYTSGASFGSVSIDNNNRPCLSYYRSSTKSLIFSRWTGSNWDNQIVDNSSDVGQCSVITVDADGNPCIAYLDATKHNVKYAHWTGNVWDVQTVGSIGSLSNTPIALSVDQENRPHLAFYTSTRSGTCDITYATVVPEPSSIGVMMTLVGSLSALGVRACRKGH